MRGQLAGKTHDLGLLALHRRFLFRKHLLILRFVGLEVGEDLFRRRALGAQLALFGNERLLGALLLGERRFERGLLLLDLLAQGAQIVDDLLVAVHDLADEVHGAEQVGKARRVEQHRPVGDGAALFHRAHTLAELFVLARLFLFVFADLLLGLLDERFVLADELFNA